MKKIMSMTGIGLVAITLLMSSCVSKKKYVEAQNTIERYRTDSARMASEAAGLQQNISGLEERQRALQTQYDSTKNYYESRWSTLQNYYNEQKSTTDQLHQSIHQAVGTSEAVDSNGIMASNGRVYLTLGDGAFSGTALSSQGKQVIRDFAGVVKDKQNVTVDVVSGDSYAAYWNASGNSDMSSGGVSGDNSMNTGNTGNTTSTDATTDDDATTSTSTTTNRNTATTNKKSNTYRSSATRSKATANRSATARRSTATKSRSESGRTYSTRSKAKASTNNSWNAKVAKATNVAKELHKNGVYNVGLMVPGQPSGTSTSTNANSNKFQLIVTPKGDRYFQMMEQNAGTTSGTNNMK